MFRIKCDSSSFERKISEEFRLTEGFRFLGWSQVSAEFRIFFLRLSRLEPSPGRGWSSSKPKTRPQNFDPTQDGAHLGPEEQGEEGEGGPGGRGLQKWVLRGADAAQEGDFRSASAAAAADPARRPQNDAAEISPRLLHDPCPPFILESP